MAITWLHCSGSGNFIYTCRIPVAIQVLQNHTLGKIVLLMIDCRRLEER